MVKIITIHGTNAGRPEDHGDQWWQKGSPFQERLQELIEDPLEIEPYHWSGANSERQRRKAGATLAKLIAKETEPPIVVGHSHGGSVAAHALFHLHIKSRRNFAKRIRTLITVGTPMLRFKGTLIPLARLHPIAQLVLVASIVLASAYMLSDWGGLAPLPVLAAAAVAILGLIYYFIRTGMRRSTTFRRNLLARALAGKYAPLNHSIDEALLALKSVARIRLTFLKARNLRGGVRLVLYSGFIIALSVSYLTLGFHGGSPYERARAPRADALYEFSPGVIDDRNDMIVQLAPLAVDSWRFEGAQLMTQFRKHVGQPGPEYGRAFARSEYIVIDYATAYAKRDFSALRDYIAQAGRTAQVSYYCDATSRQFGCDFYATALYLTPKARDLLLAAAVRLASADTAPALVAPVFVGAAPDPDKRNRYPSASYVQVEPALAEIFFVKRERSAKTPFDEILASVDSQELARGSLVSRESIPPPDAPFYASRSYPMIERGNEIVVLRNMATSYFLQCGAANALGFNPMIGEKSLFLATLPSAKDDDEKGTTGLCDQLAFVSNGPFELYRAASASLAVITMRDAVSDFFGELLFGGLADLFFPGRPQENSWLLAMRAVGITALAFLASVIGPLVIIESLAALFVAAVVRAIAAAQLKNIVYGYDGYGEEIAAVAPGIDFDQREIGMLPPDVEEKISEYSLRHSQEALRKVREIISMSATNRTSPMLADLGESITWQELIHTAYFDVPEFKEHFAKELARTAGLTLRRDPRTDHWASASLSSASPILE